MLKRYMNSTALFMADKGENDFSAHQLMNGRETHMHCLDRKNTILPFETIWRELADTVSNEISQ